MTRYTPKTKPYPHQSRAVIQAIKKKNYAIFFEPRCGKSKVALDVAAIHALRGDVRRVLIIAPRIALDVWQQQITQHFPYPYFAENFTHSWASNKYMGIHVKFPNREITTPRFFLASREETFRRTRQGDRYVRTKQKELERFRPDLIILDESHEYKRAGAVGAQDAWRMVKRLRASNQEGKPWVLLLSGTPNPKGWVDLFAPFRIMDDTIFGTAIADFRDDYVVYGTGKRRWTILRYQQESKIRRRVRANSISISAEGAGLANVQFYQTLHSQLPPTTKKAYLDMAKEFVAELSDGNIITAKNAGVKRIRLLQLCGGFTTDGTPIHNAKLLTLKEYLKQLQEKDESVVVYARFTPEVAACTSVARDLGFRTWRVDGKVKRADRQRAIAALRTRPPSPTCVVFQHQAGSRAIELVGAAEVVYYSCPDGWVDYFQTSRRVQGPNQKRPVRYTHIVCPGTVDVSVLRALTKKEDQHALLMKNPRRYLLGMIQ